MNTRTSIRLLTGLAILILAVLFKVTGAGATASNVIHPNLLPGDSSFETGVYNESWHVYGSSGSIDNSTAVDGSNSLKSSSLIFPVPVNSIEDGNTYTLSAYIKSESERSSDALMRILSSDGYRYYNFKIDNTWKRYAFTIPNFSLNKKGVGEISIKVNASAVKPSVWIDAVKLEKGDVATEYLPRDEVVLALVDDTPGRVYFKDEIKDLNFNFYNPGLAEKNLSFNYSIKDYYGKEIQKDALPLTLSAKGSNSLKISFHPEKSGFFLCNVNLAEGERTIVEKAETFCILPYAEKETEKRDPFFGIQKAWIGDLREGPRLSRIGVGTLRKLIAWSLIEPVKGHFNWEDLDREIAHLNSYHIEPMSLINAVPPWAALDGIWGSYPKIEDFADFTYQLVKRYQGRIKYYELFNEPDHFVRLPYWQELIDTGVVNTSIAAYHAQLARRAYTKAKEADSNSKILAWSAAGTCFDWWLNEGGKDFADEYLSLAKDYFDIFTGHYYTIGWFGPKGKGAIKDTKLPANLKTTIEYFKSQNIEKELWAGEQSPRLDIYVPFDSIYAKEQARAAAKLLTQTRFYGFKRYIWYLDIGNRWWPGNDHGLWREGYRPLPAVSAYATTAWLLKDAGKGEKITLPGQDGIEGYIFPKENNNIMVIWNNNINDIKKSITLPINSAQQIEEVVDYMGNSVSFEKTENGIQFECGRDPIFIKSGNSPLDVNQDGSVDILDLRLVALHFGEATTSPYPRYDVNSDATVDILDLRLVAGRM